MYHRQLEIGRELVSSMMWFGSGSLLQGWIARCPSGTAPLGTPRRATAGFWCIRWRAERYQKRRKPPTDAIGRQPLGFELTFPGQPPVGDTGTSQAELRIGRQEQPGPAVSLLRLSNSRCRPVQGLLEEADGMLHVEPMDVGPPEKGQVGLLGTVVEQP